jgi:F-type H+-transporting ATPase subunit epsilon
MSHKQIRVQIITPDKAVLDEAAEEVICPGLEGSFGILPGHVAFISALKPGMLKIKHSGHEQVFAIGGGYCEARADQVLVLAETAESAEEIDLEIATRERERAAAQLQSAERGEAYVQAEISLKKALARLNVASYIRLKKKQ